MKVRDIMIRASHPETARVYTVSYKRTLDAEPIVIDSVEGDYQRLRRHSFDPVEAQAVRIHIQAANRGAQARVFEVRCYA